MLVTWSCTSCVSGRGVSWCTSILAGCFPIRVLLCFSSACLSCSGCKLNQTNLHIPEGTAQDFLLKSDALPVFR